MSSSSFEAYIPLFLNFNFTGKQKKRKEKKTVNYSIILSEAPTDIVIHLISLKFVITFIMNNYGTAITNDEVIVPQKKKKMYPKTLLLLVPIILLIICLFNSHKNNDVVVVTKLFSNNSNSSIITINYDAARTGPICVSMDNNNNNNNNNNNDSSSSRLQLVWKENHNLYQLPNEISFRNCDFSNATLLQKAGPNPTGYMVKMNNTTTTTTMTNKVYYFACSKLCASNGHKVQVCVGNNGQENDNTKCSATVATNTNNECTAARTYDLRRQP